MEGVLDLTDFVNLEEVDCKFNQLNDLKLPTCSKIFSLCCYNNYLKSLDFLACLDSDKLIRLYITNNDFPDSDLSVFSRFTNLESLHLGNTDLLNGFFHKFYFGLYRGLKRDERDFNQVYNRFHGSLKYLWNLTKLKELAITGTDVDSGLEYLPTRLGSEMMGIKVPNLRSISEFNINFENGFFCNIDGRSARLEAKSKDIGKELEKYGELGTYGELNSALQQWREDNQELIKSAKITVEEKEQFIKQQKEINYLELRVEELTNLIKQQKDKIISAFLRLFPEQDLLQELVTKHLELTKFKKQGVDSFDYGKKCRGYKKKCQKIEDELEDKLDETTMNEMQLILTNCEELVQQELELEKKLNQKSYLIENHKKIALQITDNSEVQRIVGLEKLTNQQQIQLAKEVRTINIFVNNSSNNANNNANNMNDNSATYHNSQHNEHNQSQFHQQVPPKNQ